MALCFTQFCAHNFFSLGAWAWAWAWAPDQRTAGLRGGGVLSSCGSRWRGGPCLQRVFRGARGNMALSKHGDPVFPHFCPRSQNLPCVGTGAGGVCSTYVCTNRVLCQPPVPCWIGLQLGKALLSCVLLWYFKWGGGGFRSSRKTAAYAPLPPAVGCRC